MATFDCNTETTIRSHVNDETCEGKGGWRELCVIEKKDFDLAASTVDLTDPDCPILATVATKNGAVFQSLKPDAREATYNGALNESEYYDYAISAKYLGKSAEQTCAITSYKDKCLVLVGITNDCEFRVFGVEYYNGELQFSRFQPYKLTGHNDEGGALDGGNKPFDEFTFTGQNECAVMHVSKDIDIPKPAVIP